MDVYTSEEPEDIAAQVVRSDVKKAKFASEIRNARLRQVWQDKLAVATMEGDAEAEAEAARRLTSIPDLNSGMPEALTSGAGDPMEVTDGDGNEAKDEEPKREEPVPLKTMARTRAHPSKMMLRMVLMSQGLPPPWPPHLSMTMRADSVSKAEPLKSDLPSLPWQQRELQSW